jgi:hypothetical protein
MSDLNSFNFKIDPTNYHALSIVANEPVNAFGGHRVWREFPKAQAYTIPRDTGVKIDTLDFQGCLQP